MRVLILDERRRAWLTPDFDPKSASVGDATRFRWIEREFARIVGPRPFIKQLPVVLALGAMAFGVPVGELLHSRKYSITHSRQKLMAFARIVLPRDRCSTYEIGRAFQRDHSTVFFACEKYGAGIAGLLNREDAA